MIRKLLPHPILTLLVALAWLMLGNEFSRGGLAFGLLLGIVIPFATGPYWPDRPRLRHPLIIADYIRVVLWDIIKSNFTVAAIILFKPNRDLRPAWVPIPLALRSPEAITVLAGSITLTPGTLTAELSADGRNLLVHCLHAPDPDAVRDEIKSRYERRLMEIFE